MTIALHPAHVREVRPGRESDGPLPGFFVSAPELHEVVPAMRDYDEEDPKRPHPVWIPTKRSNQTEAAEAVPVRKDDERDRHRHVV